MPAQSEPTTPEPAKAPQLPDSAKPKPIPVQDFITPSPAPETPETSSVEEAPSIAEEPTTEPAQETTEPVAEPVPEPETDEAVESIMKQDGDEALKAQDDAAAKSVVMKSGPIERLKNWFAAFWANPKKRYGTLGTIVAIVVVLMAVPLTRYDILGLVLKEQATVQVLDTKTGAAVSGATVELGGQKALTDAKGKAVLHPHLGSKTLTVSKQYYRGYNQKQLVTLSRGHNSFRASLTALGRQVKVKIVNKITGSPVSGAVITMGSTQTKTTSDGTVAIVIPGDATTQKVSVSLAGYNLLPATITPDGNLAKNTFAITPAGKLYFLSNLSGKIDVVKTDLDGTNRQTVLAGTGNEDPNSTSLLASRDWKYLALLAKRDGDNASVYLIDTTNGDKLTTIDQGAANFNLVGWSGDTFVYTVDRTAVSLWQPNAHALKSYDATANKATLLDQTTGEGTGNTDYGYTSFSPIYILDNELFYAKNWYSSYQTNHLSGKSDTLVSIRPDGTGHKDVKDFPIPDGQSYYSVNLSLYEPYSVYVQVPNGDGTSTYYDYEDGALTAKPSVTDATFGSGYPTYLQSPSGNSTFWTEQRDGKNTLFVGDKNAQSPKQIASLSDYKPYGWYSDDYLLVSKSSSELYILPKTGGTPLKLTDYYKPPINYSGYGGGYGGL